MHMPKILDTLVPENEVFTRKKQLWHYVGMSVLLLVCGLLCTLIGVTITEWRNSGERQKLIASYSQQISDLTDKIAKAQAEQTTTLGETKEVIYEVRGLVSELAGTSAKIKSSARLVDDAAKRTQKAAATIRKPAAQTPPPPDKKPHPPTPALPARPWDSKLHKG